MTTAVSPLPNVGSLRRAFTNVTWALDRFPFAILQLMARIGVGAVFWKSGMNKIANWDLTVALFQDEYRLPVLPPDIAAYLATAMELTCPVLLALGVAARLGAAGLLGMTFVIQSFVYPESWAEHLTWATLLMLVLTRGAGPVSLDHVIARRFTHQER